jgi:alanyl-tRNA synthetase
LRAIADFVREHAKDSIGLLYQETEGKITYLLFVGPNMVKRYPADKLIIEISNVLGGGGGGRPHLAEGGGGNPKKVAKAIAFLETTVKS